MIPSTLFALVTTLSLFVAVNGAVVQRDGTFTYLTPQPTAPGQAASTTTTATSSQSSSTTSTKPTTSTTSTTTTATSSQSSSTTSTKPTTATTSTTTTQSSSVTSTMSTTPTSTSTTTSATVVPPTTTSATTTQSSSVKSTRSTTPTVTSTTATSTATPTSPPGTANCNGVQQWQASLAYTAGDQVIFDGQLFTATQWTYNNAPPAHPDQWAAGSTCAQPINNQANCNGVSAWQKTVAYTAGNRVTFNGHLWSAVQWTQSNSPGDTSGSWKDQGACA